MTTLDTAVAARAWLRSAEAGAVARYHTGLLMFDRYMDPNRPLNDELRRRAVLSDMARVLFDAAHKGLVELVQRRNGAGCEYLVIRTHRAEREVRERYVYEAARYARMPA